MENWRCLQLQKWEGTGWSEKASLRMKGEGQERALQWRLGVRQWPQRGLQTWTLKVTLSDALERKWPGQWPLGAHFEGQPQRKTLRRETSLLEIRRNHHLLTKSGRRKAEVGKRWGAVPQGTQREAASRGKALGKRSIKGARIFQRWKRKRLGTD